ncbi:glycosyltransferase family 2 protein [Asticcacaulis excentricus]|uniref:Glycosyl transferase family 2 n=1 Tax=Asticcacaulis excentricus (strain ATCC 15261 / DSM 4724 / KCTC 12464 / NCIMB 9791 / VKM B-1370 / CB 48) TaxID=573065 RepID=E8RLK6_ASTEC|nr:glycosyltransferase family 2 protein [Asticcacaulis excentricus]ADU13750.1 glycosyl transferase family 2 [Asticcacaulis excentricus CB 48]
MSPRFSLIVLSYQSGAYLERCIEALLAQTTDDFEILLVDNASSDGAPEVVVSKFPQVRLIKNGGNLGFAAGNNAAVHHARGEWLGFINPDVFVHAHWLGEMTQAIFDYPHTHIFTSLQLDPQDQSVLDGAGDGMSFFGFPFRMGYRAARPAHIPVSEVFSPCGAAFVIKRSLFEGLGGFYERFFMYCEDADLGYRARLRRERTLLIPQARVDHVGSATLGARSDFALYHGYRNRLWLFVKNTPSPILWLMLVPHLLFSLSGALKDVLKGRGPVVGRALREAVLGLGAVMRDRHQLQSTRLLRSTDLLSQFSWDLRLILRRGLDLRSPK